MDWGDEAVKRLSKWLLAIVIVLAGAFLLLRTPDTDPALMKAKYGAAPSQFVDLGGGLIVHLRDEGPRDAPVLVLLHGSNADLHTWDAWTRILSDQFRVIRYDQIGHGLTGPNPSGEYSQQEMAAVLERLRAKLGIDRFALAGNSMGGGLAARYASSYPQHLAALILVTNEQANRRTGRLALEHTGQNLDGIGLTALRHMTRGPRLATVQFSLDIGLAQCQSGRTTINDAADCRAMRFAKRGNGKQGAKSIAGHGICVLIWN
jgi:pimeloyl-ACP methyl ester carboxylesterase